MKKEFIPYQPSLDMKLIGFDEPCFGRYEYIKNELQFPFWNPKNHNIKTGDGIKSQFVSAPLYQQAFRWFREKYKLNSRITENISDNKYFYCIEKLNVTKHEDVVVAWNVNMNITYEEAELECLKKLIEIAKEQK